PRASASGKGWYGPEKKHHATEGKWPKEQGHKGPARPRTIGPRPEISVEKGLLEQRREMDRSIDPGNQRCCNKQELCAAACTDRNRLGKKLPEMCATEERERQADEGEHKRTDPVLDDGRQN